MVQAAAQQKIVPKGKLSRLQFCFLMFNYVIGFGFITTIGTVINLGGWGVFVFAATAFVGFGVLVIFSRLASSFPDTKGSSYGFAKRAHGRPMVFFQGWNQFIQGPILSVSAPIFLEQILDQSYPSLNVLWKVLSIAIFIVLIIISVLPLTTAYKYIKYLAYVKWLIIYMALILIIYLAASAPDYSTNWYLRSGITIAGFSNSMLSFIFAFGGVEGITTLTRDTDSRNIRKYYFFVFACILGLYMIVYCVLMGLNLGGIKLGSDDILNKVFGINFAVAGTVLYAVGFITNKSASVINSSLVNARNIGPMAEDYLLPKVFAKTDKFGNYRTAALVSAFVSLVLMALFQVLQLYVESDTPFLDVIQFGTIAFFLQYLFTGLTLMKLWIFKKAVRVLWWEAIVVFVMSLLIVFVLLTYMIPPVVGDAFSTTRIVQDVSYVVFILLGFALWFCVVLQRKYSAAIKLKALSIRLYLIAHWNYPPGGLVFVKRLAKFFGSFRNLFMRATYELFSDEIYQAKKLPIKKVPVESAPK